MGFSRNNQHPFILRTVAENGTMVFVFFKNKMGRGTQHRIDRGKLFCHELCNCTHGFRLDHNGKIIVAGHLNRLSLILKPEEYILLPVPFYALEAFGSI